MNSPRSTPTTPDHPSPSRAEPPPHSEPDKPPGRQYILNIEDENYAWESGTITVPQIRELAGIPADQPIQEINLETQEERTLAEDEVIRLKPGQGFSKKVKFQRGWQ